jgi:HEPN domain-containing protein
MKEARALLKLGLYDGAYYLAGYAVECALKACIAKRTQRYQFPDKKIVDKSYTHDLTQLLQTTGLQSEHSREMETDDRFALNWAVVKQWSEARRYELGIGWKAQVLYDAIADRKHGVLRWLRRHW